MRTFIQKILCACFLTTGYSSLCEASVDRSDNQKIYLDPEMISLSSSTITIQWQNKTFVSNALFVDEMGVFTLASELWSWKCPKCRSTNPDLNNICWHCHHDKPEN